jgi:nucleoside triphosphate pyrophosphatase
MKIKTDRPIILASRSPRRSNLLRQIGLDFIVEGSNIEEIIDENLSPAENVSRLALQKASQVAKKFKKGIVIGADTIVVIGKKILGKPASSENAREMLRLLSDKTHSVFTGFALLDAESQKKYIDFERTDVTFRNLDEEEIRDYVESGSPMDKAGAYGIQDDFGAVFVEKVNGCFYTVVGFPLTKFYSAFKNFIR